MKPLHEGHMALLFTIGIAIILLLLTLIQEVRADEYERVSRCTDGKIIIQVPQYTCPAGYWKV